MNQPLHVEVSDLAKAQIRAAEQWWRLNRPKAPNAIREELERASSLVSVQPEVGARARKEADPVTTARIGVPPGMARCIDGGLLAYRDL